MRRGIVHWLLWRVAAPGLTAPASRTFVVQINDQSFEVVGQTVTVTFTVPEN